jgi:hypothetical protein
MNSNRVKGRKFKVHILPAEFAVDLGSGLKYKYCLRSLQLTLAVV